MIKNLPANTVERLSLYRRILLNLPAEEKPFIYSHRLAHLLKINAAHVRRDLMLIDFSGDIHKGYDIKKLIDSIGEAIDCVYVQKVAFVGIGDLGRAVAEYFNHTETRLQVTATFRLEGEAPNFVDVRCYHISQMKEVLKKEKIELCVLAVPSDLAHEVSKELIDAGIRGILNFTSAHLKVPSNVYVEQYDMISKLEKLAYFTNKDHCGGSQEK
jgi:redox-sensing transcriptional repressor